MAALGTPARGRAVGVAAGAGAVLVLASLAARADVRAPGGGVALVVLDLAVGFSFVLASLLATGALGERLLVGTVGLAWFAGSVSAAALSLHHGVLAVALLAFPGGRLPGLPRRLLGLGAVVVAFGAVPQLGVAGYFVAVAVLATGGRAAAVYPAAAGAAVAAVLAYAWWAVRHPAVVTPLVPYQATLMAVALGFPLATRAVARSRARLADRVLDDPRVGGLPGLRHVLADILGDPDLEIDLWDPTASGYVDLGGRPTTRSTDGLRVLDGDRLLARVTTSSPVVADPPTAAAVAAAVRLALVNRELQDRQTKHVADLEASRARLVAAADRERQRVAALLRTKAAASLHEARSTLATATPASDAELSALIGLAAAELAAAVTEVQRIVAGAPPAELGEGRLRGAMAALAQHSPAQVRLHLADDAVADTAAETALFYVCSEALANASKHSGAARVVVDLKRDGDQLVLRVRDDGRGDADPTGSGLQGLADRVAAAGGHLAVSSPPGGGTTVTAAVPRRRG